MTTEVHVRSTCPSIYCEGGVDTSTHKYKECEVCKGRAYVEEWIDVRALLTRVGD